VLISIFCSTNQLGVGFCYPLDGRLVDRRAASALDLPLPIYTPGWRVLGKGHCEGQEAHRMFIIILILKNTNWQILLLVNTVCTMFPHISTELLINTLYPGLILGSFYYGYVVTQLPGGWLGSQFGGKYLFGFGVLLTSVVTMFTPAAAHHSVGMLLLVRVVEGCGQVIFFSLLILIKRSLFKNVHVY